jgi:FMN-dependent NADH-azoreductase
MTMKLLHVDSSILGAGSVSRQLSAEIVAAERRLHPAVEVVYRDLASTPVGHLSSAHLAARSGGVAETAEAQADIAAGDAMLNEFLAADIIVVGAPMYNFGIASSRHGSIGSPSPARRSAIRKAAPRDWRPASA